MLGLFRRSCEYRWRDRRSYVRCFEGSYDLIEKSFTDDERFHDFREASLVMKAMCYSYGVGPWKNAQESPFSSYLICPIPSPRCVHARTANLVSSGNEMVQRDTQNYSASYVWIQKPNTSYKLASMVEPWSFGSRRAADLGL